MSGAPARKGSLWATVKAVAWSFLGVRKSSGFQDDIAQLKPYHIIAAGLIGKLGLEGTAEAYVDGFRSMAYAALIIGFARAIYVVMDQGQVVEQGPRDQVFAAPAHPYTRALLDAVPRPDPGPARR